MKNKYYLLLCFCLTFAFCTKQESSDFDQFFFSNAGADLFVQVNGNIASNTFILFLHGGPGGSGIEYNTGYYADELEKDYAMVYLDKRGNGASTGKYDKDQLTIAQISDDIYQLTRFLKAKYGEDISLFLAGHSWGGLTSAHTLITTDIQEEIKAWIDIDGAHDYILNDIESVKFFREIASIEINNGNNLDFWNPVLERVNSMDTLNLSIEDEGFLNSTAFEAESRLPIENPTIADSGPAYSSFSPNASTASITSNSSINGILNNDSYRNPLTERLGEISIPSLFLWGKYDLVVPPAIGVIAYDRVNTEDKKMVIFEKSGHSPQSNEPELFVKEFKDFVELYK